MPKKKKQRMLAFLSNFFTFQAGAVTTGDQGAPPPQPGHNENQRSPLSQFMSKTVLKLPDQPSRDEIAARKQNSLDLFTSGRVLAEASTPSSNLALKFAVNEILHGLLLMTVIKIKIKIIIKELKSLAFESDFDIDGLSNTFFSRLKPMKIESLLNIL